MKQSRFLNPPIRPFSLLTYWKINLFRQYSETCYTHTHTHTLHPTSLIKRKLFLVELKRFLSLNETQFFSFFIYFQLYKVFDIEIFATNEFNGVLSINEFCKEMFSYLQCFCYCFQSDYFNLWHVFVFWYGRFCAISVFIVEKYGYIIGNTIQLNWEWQSMIVVFTPAFRLTLAIEWCKFIRSCKMVAIFNVNFCLRVRETGGQKLRAIFVYIHTIRISVDLICSLLCLCFWWEFCKDAHHCHVTHSMQS